MDGQIRYSITGDLTQLNSQLLQAEAHAARTGSTVGRNIATGINTQLITVGSNVGRQGTQIGNTLSSSINSSFSLRGVNATFASTFNSLPSTASTSGHRTGTVFNNSFNSGVSGLGSAITRPISTAVSSLVSNVRSFSGIGSRFGQAIGDSMGSAIDRSQGFMARRMENIWDATTNRVSEVITNGIGSAMNMATELLSDMVRVGQEAEAMKTTFSTLMGSKTKGKAVFDQGEQFAKDTPFSNDQTFGAMQQMLALSKYRKDTQLMMKDLKAVGDVAAGTGKDLSQVAYVYAQVQTQGRAMGEDLNQLANAGIPIHEALAKAMNKPVKEVKDLASKGKVTAEVMAKTFQQLTTGAGQFAGAMVNMGQTAKGQLASFEGGMDMLKGQIYEGLSRPVGTILSAFNEGLMKVINKGDLVKGLTSSFAQMAAMVEKNKVAISGLVEQGFKGAQDALLIMAQKAKEFMGWLSTPSGREAISQVAATCKDIVVLLGQLGVMTGQLVAGFIKVDAEVREIEATFNQVAVISRKVWLGFISEAQKAIDSSNLLFSNIDADLAMFESDGNKAWASFTAHIGRSISSAVSLGTSIKNSVVTAITQTIPGWLNFLNHITRNKEAAAQLGVSIRTAIGSAINSCITSVGNFTKFLSSSVQTAVNVGKSIVNSIGSAIQSIVARWNSFNTSVKNASGAVTIVSGSINGGLKSALMGVSNIATSMWKGFSNAATSAFTTVSGIATSFKDFLMGIPKALSDGFQAAANAIGGIFDSWTGRLKELAESAAAFTRGLMGGGQGGDFGGTAEPTGDIMSPLRGSLSNYPITSPMGMRNGKMHAGVDYGGTPQGTPLYAPFNAIVTELAEQNGEFILGLRGLVNNIVTTARIVHMDSVKFRPGQSVRQGELIGGVGGDRRSWNSTGAHLHYELKQNGRPINQLRSRPNRPGGTGGDEDAIRQSLKGGKDPHAGHNHAAPMVSLNKSPVPIPPSEEQQRQRTILALSKKDAVTTAARSERDLATTRNRSIIDNRHEVDMARTSDPIQKQLKEFAHQRELIERELEDFTRKFNDEITDATLARAKKIASGDKSDQTNYTGRINLLTEERNKGKLPFDLEMQKLEIEQSKFLIDANEKLGESYQSLMGNVADLHSTYGLNTPYDTHLDKLRSIKKTGDDLTKQLNLQITSEQQLASIKGASGDGERRIQELKRSLVNVTKEMTLAVDAETRAYQESVAVKERERISVEASLNSQIVQAHASRADKKGDVFGANMLRKSDAVYQLNRETENQERDLRDKAKEGGWSPEFLDAQLAKLKELNQFKLTDINAQFQTLGEAIKSKLGDELGNVLTALFDGTKSMMDVLRDSFASISKWLLQLGIKGLMGGLGLNFGGGIFSRGGMIENYAVGGSIGSAMRKERSESGLEPRLIVANVGERVLSARETQAYNRMFPKGIPNFASGGLVGFGGTSGEGSNVSVSVPITVNAGNSSEVDPAAMKRLQEGVRREIGQYMLSQSQPGGLINQIMRNR